MKKGFLFFVVCFISVLALNSNNTAPCKNGIFTEMDCSVIKDEPKRDFTTNSSYGKEETKKHFKRVFER